MRKRNERRSAIESSFDRLRASVATALGAAANEVERARAEHERHECAMRIAQHGVAAVQRDPSLAGDPDSPAFREALDEAVEQRDGLLREWTEHGPGQLADLVTESAPGTASRPWSEWLGQVGDADPAQPPPALWRIGSAEIADSPDPEPFPAAVPLLDDSHLRITSRSESRDDGTRDAAEALVQDLIMRVVSHYPPGAVRLHLWDDARLTGTLPGLHPLTRVGLLTAHDPTRLDDLLDELAEHIRRIRTNALLGGHTSLRSLADESGRRAEPWRIAVLFGAGESLRDEQQQQLQRVARDGPSCGIQLIVVDLPMTVNSAVESVSLSSPSRARTSMTGPHAVVRPDDPMPRDRVTRACSAISAAFESRRARVRGFDDLLPDQLWAHHSTSGLQAPVGFHEGESVWVTLGDASPHTLVGGPSGSGKTNFLYGMLGSLASRYSPDELEMYLLDFKEGVSFAQFTPGRRDPSWLPHAQLVGVNVNTDREFGLALLRFLSEEMRRRADAAKSHEVTKLEELRTQDPEGRWPRIVAVIDEFQYLFAERDSVSTQATTLLEDVARRGRSQGIHLVLASQDVSGIEAFWGKPAIFEQFILRIALPKARRVLVDTNHAALELPRWHAVINHESGVKHGNEIARVPDATTKDSFDSLQHRLWDRHQREQHAGKPLPPRLFDGSHLPDLAELADFHALRPGTDRSATALLGQVIDVNGTAAGMRLARSPGRNFAVLGSVVLDATNVLGAAALSLSRQHEPGSVRFTVVGLIAEVQQHVGEVVDRLRGDGHEVRHVGLADLVSTLDEVAAVLDEGTETAPVPHYVLLYAVDAAHTALERKDPQTRVSGQETLRTIIKQGPESHVHVLGWWRSAQRLKNTLGMGPVDDVGAWVGLDVHGQELSAFAASQPVTWSPRPRRGLFFDRSVHSRPEVILPFDLSGLLDSHRDQPGGNRARHLSDSSSHQREDTGE